MCFAITSLSTFDGKQSCLTPSKTVTLAQNQNSFLHPKKPWKGCKPNFVCAGCPAERIIYLLRPYPGLEPFPIRGRTAPCPLFGLAPNGVCRAALLALGAVCSYPTFSPLPRPKPWRFIFCGTFRQPTLASGLPECIPGGTGVTRHRVLRCSDFPLPINWKRSSTLPRCEKDKR